MSVELETFLGEWKDSFGNDVTVDWAKAGSRGGQLSVVLTNPKSSRPPIRLDVKSTGSGFACGHYDLDTEKSSEDCIIWLDTRRSGKSSIWKRDGVKRSCSRSRSGERHAAGRRSARQARRGSRSRSHGRGRPKVDETVGTWGAGRYGLPSPAVYWAQAAPGGLAPGEFVPRMSRSAAASEGPTPGAWVPPSMEKREPVETPSLALALPAPAADPLGGIADDFLGAALTPIARAAPVKVLPPPPLVDEMEEFDKLLLQIEEHEKSGSILARSAEQAAKAAAKAAQAKLHEEQLQRERQLQLQREKEQREQREREEQQEQLAAQKKEKSKVENSKPRQSKLPAPRGAVKVEIIEDDKDQVAVAPVKSAASARDPRTRPARDPRLQDDDETTVKVLVDPYLEHVEPEPDVPVSVEVLRQPKAQAVPKRQRKAAPKKAVAKHPPAAPLPSEEKLLEIKQLLQRETQSTQMAAPPPPAPPGLPGLPAPGGAPMTPRTPATPITPAPQDEAQQKRLMAYSMLLLGGGDDDKEETAPWKKKRRRAVGDDL